MHPPDCEQSASRVKVTLQDLLTKVCMKPSGMAPIRESEPSGLDAASVRERCQAERGQDQASRFGDGQGAILDVP